MGERPAKYGVPPLDEASSSAGNSAGDGFSVQSLGNMKWPPQGWPMFSCITQNAGLARQTSSRQAPHGQPLQARTEEDFLKYQLSANADGIYQIEIFSGCVGRHGVTEKPAIGIRFAARKDWFDDNPENAIVDIHVNGQQLLPEKGAILRVILAMTFIISRIDRGLAPSIKRVLKTYRLS